MTSTTLPNPRRDRGDPHPWVTYVQKNWAVLVTLATAIGTLFVMNDRTNDTKMRLAQTPTREEINMVSERLTRIETQLDRLVDLQLKAAAAK